MESQTRKLQNLLDDLAKTLELEPTSPSDKEPLTRWKITPSHELCFGVLDYGFALHCMIGTPPPRNKEDFYLLLMRANFLGQGTGNAVIGMDKEEKYLTLSSMIPYDVDIKRFKEIIEDFVNFVDYWRGELTRHAEQASGPFG
ncbi:MAG: type III secretion system chaperone [Simkania sp.]|nr:type III secretion system chaperone [Simkania sp.]